MMSITSRRFIFEIKKASVSDYSGDQLFQIPRAWLFPTYEIGSQAMFDYKIILTL